MAAFKVRNLEPEELTIWDSFVDSSPQGSVFSKSIWLDAVSDNYRVLGCFKNGELLGGIALVQKKIGWINTLRVPVLTPFQGIIFGHNPKMSDLRRTSIQHEIINNILNFLDKRYKRIVFNNYYSLKDVRPFIWKGYDVTVKYSFTIDLAEPDKLLQNMESRTRYEIKKGERNGIVVFKDNDIEKFDDLHRLVYEKQRKKCPVSTQQLHRIHNILSLRDICNIYFAANKDGTLCSAIFIVTDKDVAYYLMGASHPDFRANGSTSLALWTAIKELSTKFREFDLVGANIPSIAMFKRGFGGKLKSYYRIEKINSIPLYFVFKGLETLRFLRSRMCR